MEIIVGIAGEGKELFPGKWHDETEINIKLIHDVNIPFHDILVYVVRANEAGILLSIEVGEGDEEKYEAWTRTRYMLIPWSNIIALSIIEPEMYDPTKPN